MTIIVVNGITYVALLSLGMHLVLFLLGLKSVSCLKRQRSWLVLFNS